MLQEQPWPVAPDWVRARHLLVVGRGQSLAIAHEIALKCKEVCQLHAEAISAAELRHGPQALADAGLHVLALAPDDLGAQALHETATHMTQLGAVVADAAQSRLVLSEGIEGDGIRYYQQACALELEGVVAKRLDSLYLPGKRTDAWMKIKRVQYLDCAILGFVLLSAVINLFMGSASAKWALMAPVFVPMLMLVGYPPELTQAAYRVGDSVTNIISPMMSYFALIIAFFQRYEPRAGIGTLVATMLPYSLVFFVGWSALFAVWLAVGLPIGPGAPLDYAAPAGAG